MLTPKALCFSSREMNSATDALRDVVTEQPMRLGEVICVAVNAHAFVRAHRTEQVVGGEPDLVVLVIGVVLCVLRRLKHRRARRAAVAEIVAAGAGERSIAPDAV